MPPTTCCGNSYCKGKLPSDDRDLNRVTQATALLAWGFRLREKTASFERPEEAFPN